MRPLHKIFTSPLVLVWACAASLLAVPARAQTVFDQNGFGSNRDSYSVLPYESVDPLSGNLLLVATDLSLPGNAGLNLSIQRVYNSALYPYYNNGGDRTLEEDSWAGIGWRLHFGRVLHEDLNGAGDTEIEMSDGSRHALYHASGGSAGWITKEFWSYNKLTHTLSLPNGVVYTFGRAVFLNPALGTVRYVTEIRDQFDNTITFTYFDANGPADGVAQIHQDLGQGQSRDVTFTYNATLRSLASMSYAGLTWTYTQVAFGPSGYSALVGVQPPAGLPWGYDYAEPSGYVGLTRMRVPGGGTVDYTYADAMRVVGATSRRTRVVSTRAIGGDRITPGTWTFTYNGGGNQDTTTVSCPCGITTYRYNGIGGSGTFNPWLVGTLAERNVYDAGGLGGNILRERQLFTWQPSEPVSADAVPPENGWPGDAAVYKALLASRVTTRGSQTQTTSYEYDSGHGTFSDFGRPYRITQSGDLWRITTRIFQYGFSRYIVDRVASEQIQVGPEIVSSSYLYDPATGFMTRQTSLGVITQFEATAQGNMLAVTDPNGRRTSFTYQWGVVANTTTPLITTSRTIDSPGNVLSETIGSLTTTYVYDAGLRLKRIQPPNANPSVYEYDDLNQGWIRIARDQAQTSLQLDGFGRTVHANNRLNLQTRTVRDACGRAIFQSAPYTAGAGTRGVTTAYDALGRVTQITAADNTSVSTFAYDGVDVTVTDPGGRTTFQNYSAFGDPGDVRLMSVRDSAVQTTQYTYDVLGHLTRVTGPGSAPAREWVYNGKGWLDHVTEPESGTTSFQYDLAGHVTRVTDAKGQIVNLAYDANDRLTSRDATGTEGDITSITYDAASRVSVMQTPIVTTTLGYDTAGRLASRTDQLASGLTKTSSYLYDANDNLTRLNYPSGRYVTYTYDIENRLLAIAQNGATFANGFTYDDSGRLASYVTGVVTQTIAYDARDRVSRLTAGAGGATPFDLTYHYNAVNHVTSIDDARPGMGQTFGYDALDRLTSANGPYGPLSWIYDAAGNRLNDVRVGINTSYAYDPSTQRLMNTTGGVADTFTYDAIGQLASDGRGRYTYAATHQLTRVTDAATGTTILGQYAYDGTGERITRQVSGHTEYSFRSADGQTLSDYEDKCGTLAWTRDLIYAGTKLLGAVKANQTLPSVAFTSAASSGSEGGLAQVAVAVTTPGGAPLACPVTVAYDTQSGTQGWGAALGSWDYVAKSGLLTFPSGTASGSTQTISVTLLDGPTDEPDESFKIALSSPIGATLGANAVHTFTVLDNDQPPTITMSDISVNESASQAVFTLTFSHPSVFDIQVNYVTQDESAHAGYDYTYSAGTRVIPGGSGVTHTIVVPVTNEGFAEPAESFRLALSGPVNATLGNVSARATIAANDGTRVPIDPSLPGNYFADGTALAGYDDFIIIGNRHAVGLTARLTFTKNDGTGVLRDVAVPASGRLVLRVGDQPGVGAEDVSIAVQSLNASYPLDADHSVYWGANLQAGRSTEGVSPSQTWYFAEGSVGYFEEYITIFNPSPAAADVWLGFDGPWGPLGSTWQHIEPGPGRQKIRVRDFIGTSDHGTRIWATTPVVVERTMTWQVGADEREGHSSPGSPVGATTWYFAEGDTGFSTYLALLNLASTTANVRVDYLHQNGTVYQQNVTIGANLRTSVTPPASVPAGSFGYRITSTTGEPIVAERSMYGGANWTLGTSGVGQSSLTNVWFFEEGGTASIWDTFILLANPGSTTANVWIAFIRDDGALYWQFVAVAPGQRQTVSVDGVPGVTSAGFRTEVRSDVPIIAERATYWPATTGWHGAHITGGRK